MFEFEEVHIHTWNPLEQHSKYHVHLKSDNFWFNRIAKIDPALHDWDLSRRFLCFYHRPTAARLGLAGYLKQHYSQHSTIHFSTTTDPDNITQFEFDKLLDYDVDSVAPAAQLLKELPLLQNSATGYTTTQGYFYNDPLTQMYKHTLIDVVVESHVAGRTFFPTEKTIRPMVGNRPFIVYGPKNYLANLKQKGFQTFESLWDESYDHLEGQARWQAMSALIDHLINLPTSQWLGATMAYETARTTDSKKVLAQLLHRQQSCGINQQCVVYRRLSSTGNVRITRATTHTCFCNCVAGPA